MSLLKRIEEGQQARKQEAVEKWLTEADGRLNADGKAPNFIQGVVDALMAAGYRYNSSPGAPESSKAYVHATGDSAVVWKDGRFSLSFRDFRRLPEKVIVEQAERMVAVLSGARMVHQCGAIGQSLQSEDVWTKLDRSEIVQSVIGRWTFCLTLSRGILNIVFVPTEGG